MVTVENPRLLQALLRQPVDRTPLWLMRQAGRYLPEYRALRAEVPDFMTFCKNPALATTATLQPLARFDLDAAIVFSDILVVPDAMGATVSFEAGEGPRIACPIRTREDVAALTLPRVETALSYVLETIARVRSELNNRVPLIGFAGSPWTVGCYCVEGAASRGFLATKTLLYRHPDVLTALLERLTEVTIAYLNAQVRAGAQVLMVFDTWGGLLSNSAYAEFSLRYLRMIAASVLRSWEGAPIPLIFFTKQGGLWIQALAESGCDALGLDWTMDIGVAREAVKGQVALQGNLDPAILFSTPERIEAEVIAILSAYGAHSGHVFNLGHGIEQHTPVENVQALVQAVREHSPAYTARVSVCS